MRSGRRLLGRRGIKGDELGLQVPLFRLEDFAQFTGHKAHGLFQETPFSKGKILGTADEEEFAQDVGDDGKVRTLKAFGILAEAPVPVLACVDGLLGIVAQRFPDVFCFLGADQSAQTNIRGIFDRYHEGDTVGPDAHDVEIARRTTNILAVDALYLAHSLSWVHYKLFGCKHFRPRVEVPAPNAKKNSKWGKDSGNLFHC